MRTNSDPNEFEDLSIIKLSQKDDQPNYIESQLENIEV